MDFKYVQRSGGRQGSHDMYNTYLVVTLAAGRDYTFGLEAVFRTPPPASIRSFSRSASAAATSE